MDLTSGIAIGNGFAFVGAIVYGLVHTNKSEKARCKREEEQEALRVQATHEVAEKLTLADSERSRAASAALIKAKDDLIAVQQERAEAWKTKWEVEHKEYTEYRADAHKQLNQAQVLVLQHTEEVAQLRARTDLTPILKHQEEQARQYALQVDINMKFVGILAKISSTMDAISGRILGKTTSVEATETPLPIPQ